MDKGAIKFLIALGKPPEKEESEEDSLSEAASAVLAAIKANDKELLMDALKEFVEYCKEDD